MRLPYSSESVAPDQKVIPCPESWMTQLMIFVPGTAALMPSPRRSAGFESGVGLYRFGLEFVTSKPQNHVYAPLAMISVGVLLPKTAGFTLPSRVARSPGYCRTTIGKLAVPVR